MRSVQAIIVALAIVSAPLLARCEIIISEIMYNPAGDDYAFGSGGFNREWIELFNAGSEPVNLQGWSIGDLQDDEWASPFPYRIVSPGQAIVVTGDSGEFDRQWGTASNRIEISNFPELANSPSSVNEVVALRDNLGVIRDEVNFDAANGWPRVDGANGQSIYLLPEGLNSVDNDLGANWRPATWGAYGARYINVNGENHASPGIVDTQPQEAFAPSPDAVWSMMIIPDSQNYVKSSQDRGKFTQQTEWIRENRDTFNIQVVLHEGDIVNNNNVNSPTSGDMPSNRQWNNARTSMSVLNGYVPYVLAAGNHDYGTTNAQDRQTFINDYFKPGDNPLIDPAQGGILKGTMEPDQIQNAYYEFTAPDGREILILALEWEPRPATVAWANEVAGRPEFEDHTAIFLTHAYLQGNDNRYASSRVDADYSGNELWNGLVRHHDNFEMTFNGHFGGDGSGYLASQGIEGNIVHQMFFNTQFETQGGNGWLRVVEFLADGKTVRVRTYSPLLDLERDHPAWHFEFEVSQIDVVVPTLAGDYNGDNLVDAADFTLWRDTVGSTEFLAADGNGDGVVDDADYLVWKHNFGQARLVTSQLAPAVPEPNSAVAWIIAMGVLASALRRHT